MTALLAPPLRQTTALPGLAELQADYPAWTIEPCALLPDAERGCWLTATWNSHVMSYIGVARMREAIEDFEAGRGWF